jgi:hypothetical protein
MKLSEFNTLVHEGALSLELRIADSRHVPVQVCRSFEPAASIDTLNTLIVFRNWNGICDERFGACPVAGLPPR